MISGSTYSVPDSAISSIVNNHITQRSACSRRVATIPIDCGVNGIWLVALNTIAEGEPWIQVIVLYGKMKLQLFYNKYFIFDLRYAGILNIGAWMLFEHVCSS